MTTPNFWRVYSPDKRKPCRGSLGRVHTENSTDGKLGTWWPIEGLCVSTASSVFRANLHGFHASLGFRSGLERAVVDNGRRRRGRLLINDGAFLGRRVPHDVEFSGLSEGRRYRESDDSARKQELLHSFLRRCLFAWE